MTKGKYAARAANRLANLDNELLQKVIKERDALASELDQERLKFQAAQRTLYSRVIKEAQSLAASDIAHANKRAEECRSELVQVKSDVAKWMRDTLMRVAMVCPPDSAIFPLNLMQQFESLVGDQAGAYVAAILEVGGEEGFNHRRNRRSSSKKSKAWREFDGRAAEHRRERLLNKFKEHASKETEARDVEEA